MSENGATQNGHSCHENGVNGNGANVANGSDSNGNGANGSSVNGSNANSDSTAVTHGANRLALENGSMPLDVDTPTKFVTYTMMAWVATEWMHICFHQLGLHMIGR